MTLTLFGGLMALALPAALLVQTGARARDLGIPLDGTPGRWNAITDVTGVEVGATTAACGCVADVGLRPYLGR